jgi:hypothetical protein
LHAVRYGECPVDPFPATSVVGYEAHDEWPGGRTKCHHQCPYPHFLASLAREECLRHDCTADGNSRRDEECYQEPSDNLRCIAVAFSAANIAGHGAECGHQPDWSSAKAIRDWFPEKWGKPQNEDLNTGEVRSFREGNTEVESEVFESWDDTCCSEGRHHGVEGDQEEVDIFLDLV